MQAVNHKQLFLASRIALIATAMTFAFRAALEGTWGTEFNLTNEQIGWIFAPAFYGFTLAMIFGGPLCDFLGMKKLVAIFTEFSIGHFQFKSAVLFGGCPRFPDQVIYWININS